MTPKFLYLTEADLFRVGNAESPRLDHIRASDVDTFDLNGLRMVQANGKGISLFTEEELSKRHFAGWVWKIPAETTLPDGLGLHNDHDGHFHALAGSGYAARQIPSTAGRNRVSL